jgi:phytoene dehydrogenase-like protein
LSQLPYYGTLCIAHRSFARNAGIRMPLPGYEYDAVVVGAGPNGLSAAAHLVSEGYSVRVIEANEEVGGACRSAAVTEPGFIHDLGSAVHPFAVASPFLQRLPLDAFGLRWRHPEAAIAHPLDGGRCVLQFRDIDRTAERLGVDRDAYRELYQPFVESWDRLAESFLRPLIGVPKHPLLLAQFGLRALMPALRLSESRFESEEARALFGGIAAHSGLPMDALASSAIGLVLAMIGHTHGWPVPEGGSSAISDALAAYIRKNGGEIETGRRIARMSELPQARVVLFDVTPRQLVAIAGEKMPASYRRRLESYRYGPASFKLDYALDGPIPWINPDAGLAATVHLGGSMREIAASEAAVSNGKHPEQPYVLLTQPTVCDRTRAPAGKHVAWAYCHVPLGSDIDMTRAVEAQIERHAPGFRDCVLHRRVTFPAGLNRENANLVEGDIMGGSSDLWQLVARPVLSPTPYRTPIDRTYLCSSSTPPGPGVHGMCGYHAARIAAHDHLR